MALAVTATELGSRAEGGYLPGKRKAEPVTGHDMKAAEPMVASGWRRIRPASPLLPAGWSDPPPQRGESRRSAGRKAGRVPR